MAITDIKFTNNARTLLSTSSLADDDTSVAVDDGSVFPALTGDNYFYATLERAASSTTREIVKVNARSGNTLTIVRAQDNTSATTFSADDIIELRVVAKSLEDIRDAVITQEEVEDHVGGMLDGTETFISVSYDDGDGNIDFVVPVKDEDNMASDSATHLSTQQSIKAYVDDKVVQTILTLYKYTATAGQTTFTGSDDGSTTLAYTAGSLFVTLNGLTLENGTDYTATNGTSVVLTDAATVSDELNIYAFGVFNAANVTGAGGDFSIADDLSFTSDAAVINMGAGSDVTITHNHDIGITLNSKDISGVKSINGNQLGGRNYLINGDFAVAQRGTTLASGSNADTDYTLDRWKLFSDTDDVVDVTQITSGVPTGNKYALDLDGETANKKFGVAQIIENVNCGDLIGQTVTLSFKAKVNATTNMDNVKAAIIAWSSTADAPTDDMSSAWGAEGTAPTLASNFTYEGSTPADLNVTTSWADYSVSAAVDTSSCTNVIVFIWSDVTTTTAGTDHLYLANVQLELGSHASNFQTEGYEENLARCQRYFNKIALASLYKYSFLIAASSAGGTYQRNYISYPVTMRSATQTNTGTAYSSGTLQGAAVDSECADHVIWQTNVTAVGNYSWMSGDLTNDCEL